MASLDNITGSDYSWSGSVGSLSFNALDRLITPLPVWVCFLIASAPAWLPQLAGHIIKHLTAPCPS